MKIRVHNICSLLFLPLLLTAIWSPHYNLELFLTLLVVIFVGLLDAWKEEV